MNPFRALEIAAVGRHPLALVGYETDCLRLARMLHNLLPPMDLGERTALSYFHLRLGQMSRSDGLLSERPMTVLHYPVDMRSFMGDREGLGEIHLTHGGTLFAGEFGAYPAKLRKELIKTAQTGLRRSGAGPRELHLCRLQLVGHAPSCDMTCGVECVCSSRHLERAKVHALRLFEQFRLIAEVSSGATPEDSIEDMRLRVIGAQARLRLQRGRATPVLIELDRLDESARDWKPLLVEAATIAALDGAQRVRAEHINEASALRRLPSQENDHEEP